MPRPGFDLPDGARCSVDKVHAGIVVGLAQGERDLLTPDLQGGRNLILLCGRASKGCPNQSPLGTGQLWDEMQSQSGTALIPSVLDALARSMPRGAAFACSSTQNLSRRVTRSARLCGSPSANRKQKGCTQTGAGQISRPGKRTAFGVSMIWYAAPHWKYRRKTRR